MLLWRSEVRVRKGKSADAQALAEVFRLSWQGAYRGIIPHIQLDNIVRRRGASWWSKALRNGDRILVLEFQDKVAGYVTFGPARRSGRQQGEIYELYLAPVYQGLGLGELLFEAARSQLDSLNCDGLIIWALADNIQAADFYWRRGGRPAGETTEQIGGARLKKVAYAWS